MTTRQKECELLRARVLRACVAVRDQLWSRIDRSWRYSSADTSLPVTTAPIDRSPSGLTIGVQIIGPYLEDRTTLAFAEHLAREFGGFVSPPGYGGS